MNKPIIAIDAGHFSSSPGVVNKDLAIVEHDQAKKVVAAARAELSPYCDVKGFHGTINQKIQQLKKYDDLRLLIEVHFNAYVEMPGQLEAGGTMTLYCPGSKRGKALAKYIQSSLIGALGLKDRGVRKGYYRLNSRNRVLPMLCKTQPPAIIVEPLFIDPGEEAKLLLNSETHKQIAIAIAKGVREWLA